MPTSDRAPSETAKPADRLNITKWLKPGYDPSESSSGKPSHPPRWEGKATRPRETPTITGKGGPKPAERSKTPKAPATHGDWGAPSNLIEALKGEKSEKRATSEPPKNLKIRYQMYNNPQNRSHSEQPTQAAAMSQPKPPSKPGVESTPYKQGVKRSSGATKTSDPTPHAPGGKGREQQRPRTDSVAPTAQKSAAPRATHKSCPPTRGRATDPAKSAPEPNPKKGQTAKPGPISIQVTSPAYPATTKATSKGGKKGKNPCRALSKKTQPIKHREGKQTPGTSQAHKAPRTRWKQHGISPCETPSQHGTAQAKAQETEPKNPSSSRATPKNKGEFPKRDTQPPNRNRPKRTPETITIVPGGGKKELPSSSPQDPGEEMDPSRKIKLRPREHCPVTSHEHYPKRESLLPKPNVGKRALPLPPTPHHEEPVPAQPVEDPQQPWTPPSPPDIWPSTNPAQLRDQIDQLEERLETVADPLKEAMDKSHYALAIPDVWFYVTMAEIYPPVHHTLTTHLRERDPYLLAQFARADANILLRDVRMSPRDLCEFMNRKYGVGIGVVTALLDMGPLTRAMEIARHIMSQCPAGFVTDIMRPYNDEGEIRFFPHHAPEWLQRAVPRTDNLLKAIRAHNRALQTPQRPLPMAGQTPPQHEDQSQALQDPAEGAVHPGGTGKNKRQKTADPVPKDIEAGKKPLPRFFIDHSISEGPSFATAPAMPERPQRHARMDGPIDADPSCEGDVENNRPSNTGREQHPTASASSKMDSGDKYEDGEAAKQRRRSHQVKDQTQRTTRPSYLVTADYLEDESDEEQNEE